MNKAILSADEIKIEYNTYWAKPNRKLRHVKIALLNKDQIQSLKDKEQS